MRTNCKNCGAVIDQNLLKCPYCGTRYVDLAIEEDEPFFFRFKNRAGQTITAKCKIRTPSFTVSHDSVAVCGGKGNYLMSFYPSTNATIDVTLDCLTIDEVQDAPYFMVETKS